MYSFSYLEPVCCSMSCSNCCFLICIQVSQETGQVVMAILRIYSSILFIVCFREKNKKHTMLLFIHSVVSNSSWCCGMPEFPVLHYLPEFAQIHVHWVDDVLQYLIFCHPHLLLPSIFPSIKVFSNESALSIRWPKFWSFSFSISPSNVHSVLISFRTDRCWILSNFFLTSVKNRNAHEFFILIITPLRC